MYAGGVPDPRSGGWGYGGDLLGRKLKGVGGTCKCLQINQPKKT